MGGSMIRLRRPLDPGTVRQRRWEARGRCRCWPPLGPRAWLRWKSWCRVLSPGSYPAVVTK